MADSREIVLDKTYTIAVPLTLGQLIDCNVAVGSVPKAETPAEESRRAYDRTLAVIAAAVAPEHPELTVEALKAMRGVSLKTLNAAAKIIYEESGLIARGEDAAGEG